MTAAIFRSPMSFLETTPAGQILNRFSRYVCTYLRAPSPIPRTGQWLHALHLGSRKIWNCSQQPSYSDMYRVDQGLPRQFNMLFVNVTKILFTLAIISAGTPMFAVLIVPLASIYIFMQRYYLKTKRELKRLDSTTRSPVFAHFQESLGGITTIRAYSQQKQFSLENEKRLDANMRAYFPSISANRWLGVRLEFIGSIIIFSAARLAIASVSMGSGLPAGMVGLAISYSLSVPYIKFFHTLSARR